MKQTQTPEKVIAVFKSEFSPLLSKFEIYSFSISEARISEADYVWKPGCYVFCDKEHGVLKVGRSFSNSRKRALEHIRDDTGGKMKDLENSEGSNLILFNLKLEKDMHWAAAVEVFLENSLDPSIPSKRLG
ncbi:MAG: hypothetical protein V2B15_09525 [Bacteroidota bacterium]